VIADSEYITAGDMFHSINHHQKITHHVNNVTNTQTTHFTTLQRTLRRKQSRCCFSVMFD